MMYSNKGFVSVEDFSLQPVADSPFKIGFFGHSPQLCDRPGLNLADSFLADSHFCSKLTKCFWLISIEAKSREHNLLLYIRLFPSASDLRGGELTFGDGSVSTRSETEEE